MAEVKTKVTSASVGEFIDKVEDEKKKADAKELLKIFKEITGHEPKMWGPSIIGYGSYHYKSKSGSEGDWPLVGFSPRKQNLTLYILTGFDSNRKLLDKLGKHKISVGCLYIKRLSDIDIDVLKQIIKDCFETMKRNHQINE